MATHSSILAKEIDRGAWYVTVHGVAKSRTRQHICMHAAHLKFMYYHTSNIPQFLNIEEFFFIFKKWMDEVRDSQSLPKKTEQF